MTEAIVPRWEWRMFAERFGAVERRLASRATAPPQVSDEMYVLGLRSEASVKVRDGLMDVKRLEHVGDHGLEQWRPVMKAAFPLAQADFVRVIEALGASPAELERAEIDRQIELYRARGADQCRVIVGLQANRAPVILAGACIVRGILVKLGRESLTFSDRGLRHGLLVERVPAPDVSSGGCGSSVR